MKSYVLDELNYISHEGRAHDENPPGRGSGRYPWGTGQRLHQRDWEVYDRIQKYKAQGMNEKQIAESMGFTSTNQLRAVKQMSTNVVKRDKQLTVEYYQHTINPDTGKVYTPTEIGRIMGVNESTVRSIATSNTAKNTKIFEAADTLEKAVKAKKYIDVGQGVELELGLSPDSLNTTLEVLKQKGYTVGTVDVKQVSNPTQMTTYRVLADKGIDEKDIKTHKYDIKTLSELVALDDRVSDPNHPSKFMPPKFIDLDKVYIKYPDEGGTARDGEIMIKAHKDENGRYIPDNPELSLGNARDAQVRIAVNTPDGPYYAKGMAVYSDSVPEGYDMLVNSNKLREHGYKKSLKEFKDSETNPFGSAVVQTWMKDKDGNYILDKDGNKQVSAVNVLGSAPTDMHQEGHWSTWSRNTPAQFLAKQGYQLAKQQLQLKIKQSEDELSDILNYTNPTIKKQLLIDIADQFDGDSVSLKAAPFAGQEVKVILPVPSLKDTECYCPSLPDGTTVALIRYPHAGPFEIPICKVNNRNKEGKDVINNIGDAIGINQAVASKLSGADFDGDTATVIPMTRKNSQGEFEMVTKIKSANSLPGLEGFDPGIYGLDNPRFANMKDEKGNPTYPLIRNTRQRSTQMGIASNLITDMYAKGCENEEELSRAVRFSMVIIDAYKHKLNYKAAYEDYGIEELKRKYQQRPSEDGEEKYGGASSLLSRSKSQAVVEARSMAYNIDPVTGEKIYRAPKYTTKAIREKVKVVAPDDYVNPKTGRKSKYMIDPETGKQIIATTDGKIVKNKDGTYRYDRGSGKELWETKGYEPRTQKSTQMAEAKDARELLSDNPNEVERLYADYANHMKVLANRARLESLRVKEEKADPKMRQMYSAEVESLNDKLVKAKANSVRERQANLIASSRMNAAYNDNPDMDGDEKKKLRGTLIKEARYETGAYKDRVRFTDREWEAIQNHAISPSMLTDLLKNADKDDYLQRAMPKQDRIGSAKRSRIKALAKAGFTFEEIAKQCGVSTSSINKVLNG